MFSLRSALALILGASLCLYPSLCGAGSKAPLGILTQAYDAHLNEAAAFPGLSVFEGEDISTEAEGRLGVRVGRTMVLLAGSSSATLHGIDSGAHVDLTAGTVSFSSPENGIVEIHAEEAFLRPEKNQLTQAEVTILAPGVLQIRARRGDLAFRYREEFQVLPEGATYRIYLDSPAEPQDPADSGAQKSTRLRKVSYFVVGSAGAGLTAWGVYEFTHSGSSMESPSKP
ncbi:MAG: hypothetical protein WCE53_09970 [Candidatus Acidiferrum sp.]